MDISDIFVWNLCGLFLGSLIFFFVGMMRTVVQRGSFSGVYMGFRCVFSCVEAGFCVLRLVALGFAQIVLAGESSGCKDKWLWSWWFPMTMEQLKMREMGAKVSVGIFVGCLYVFSPCHQWVFIEN